MVMVRRRLMLAALLLSAATPSVVAQVPDPDREARWRDLRHAIFQDRTVQSGLGSLQLDAPARALDAALVPVTIRYSGPARVDALYLVVDGNPSPLAGTFHFGPAADMHELRTRLRVDQYTLIHAVAELADGRLIESAAFVKAAGGCSAPASGNPQLAMQRMGQMRLRLQGDIATGRPATAELLVSHPNANGMQMDPVTRLYTPARYIQSIKVSVGQRTVFDLDADISLSEDPAFTFSFVPGESGPLHVDIEDSAHATFRRDFDLPVKGS